MFKFATTQHLGARLVLAWYVLFVAITAMACVTQPRSIEVVCSSMGVMKLMVQSDESGAPSSMAMDCPLCAHITPVLPPSPALSHALTVHFALSYALLPVVQAVLVSLTAPPLPSRGPPVFS